MKKLLSIFTLGLLIAIAIPKESNAQANTIHFKSVTSRTSTLDTITNATTQTQYGLINGYQDVVTIQTTITKISGTTAGAAYLYGSLDNVTYVKLTTDSLALANVSGAQSKIWNVNPSTVQYYQIRVVPTGTQSTKMSTFAIYRKH